MLRTSSFALAVALVAAAASSGCDDGDSAGSGGTPVTTWSGGMGGFGGSGPAPSSSNTGGSGGDTGGSGGDTGGSGGHTGGTSSAGGSGGGGGAVPITVDGTVDAGYGAAVCPTVYFSSDDESFYVAVTGQELGAADGPWVVVLFQNADGANAANQAFTFPSGGFTYAVYVKGQNNVCYKPFDGGEQCGTPSTWAHYAGWSGNPVTEVAIDRDFLGAYNSGSGDVVWGVYVLSDNGSDTFDVALSCPDNGSGAVPYASPLSWSSWTSTPYPAL